jgi:pimeloyl-ACP methyl ester carboxylesterase
MSTITTKDGTQIYYKDWGKGQPIVFSHGWPLSADDWDTQMLFFGQRGYRVIAHDRRGHGRSSQTWDGHDMDHYADDLAALTAHLDLKDAIHVGHSTGGGEVVHYLARHGESRVAKAAIISAVPPLMHRGTHWVGRSGTRDCHRLCDSLLRQQRPQDADQRGVQDSGWPPSDGGQHWLDGRRNHNVGIHGMILRLQSSGLVPRNAPAVSHQSL